MRRARAFVGLLAAALAAASCGWLRPQGPRIAPPQQVDMDPEVLAKFQREIEEYVELHQVLLRRMPNVGANSTAEQIEAHRKKMTEAIRTERRKARQGEVFRKDVEAAFRRIIAHQLSGDGRQGIVQGVKDGNPGVEGIPSSRNPTREAREPVSVVVNGLYDEDAPLSTVPPSLLLKLPPLPEQVRYRFVGRDLILRDAEANVILDYIKNAVPDPSIPR